MLQNTRPTILCLFNRSLYAPMPWLRHGYPVVSVDYGGTDHDRGSQENQEPEGHYRLSIDLSDPWAHTRVLEGLEGLGVPRVGLVLSFAPCTDLAVSGARHFARKALENPSFQRDAVRMARLGACFGVPYAIENPVSVLSTWWRAPDVYYSPSDYAGYCPLGPHPEFPGVIPEQDRYQKKSCLWTGNGFIIPEKAPMDPLEGDNPGWKKLGGKSARTKYIRSLTPRGLANAIFYANFRKLENVK